MTEVEELAEFVAGAIAKAVTAHVRNGRRPPPAALELARVLHGAASGGMAAQNGARPRKGRHSEPVSVLLVDAREAAAMLAVCERTVRTMAQDGRLVAVRIGGAVRFRRADLEALAAASPRSFRDSLAAKDTTTPSTRVGRGSRSPSPSADPGYSSAGAA